ncbi:hypothetical protein R1sor_019996 [Riccia sorocarpa]|uniref:Uncharacterized protein n=1 Tax=Riccia sorocarpa TaxID=122646 RepID=A0ABD3IKC6_9MARC
MASHLKNVAGFPNISGEAMKKRFDRYVSMYKKTREFKDSTRIGLSEKKSEACVTIEEKLEKRANIAPLVEESVGLPENEEIIGLDSQLSKGVRDTGNEEDDWDDDYNFGEGLTLIEIEKTTDNLEERVEINLVDVELGSDEWDINIPREDESCRNFMNEIFRGGS